MCCNNNFENLQRFRNKRTPLILEKTAQLDEKTGLAYTQFNGPRDRVWWKKGTIVKPTRILPPRKHGQACTAGLYFDVNGRFSNSFSNSFHRVTVKARIQPKDIIGVDSSARIICVVAAKVLQAPDPDQREMRIKFLEPAILRAELCIKDRKPKLQGMQDEMQRWLEEDERQEEAYQQMLAEMTELKKNAGK